MDQQKIIGQRKEMDHFYFDESSCEYFTILKINRTCTGRRGAGEAVRVIPREIEKRSLGTFFAYSSGT